MPDVRRLLGFLLILTACAGTEIRECCRFLSEPVPLPTRHVELATIDRVLVERTQQTVSQCRELKGSFSVAFRIHFAERLLPELCSRLERARGLAQHDEAFRQAAGAYQRLLLDSQVLQLGVAVMSMAESADRADQPTRQVLDLE